MGQLLPLLRTTPSLTAWGLSNARTFRQVFGRPIGLIALSTMFGQFAFETGWGVSCWRWNLGNERTGPLNPPDPNGWAGDYCELKTADEYDRNGNRIIVGGYFRAFGSLEDGALEHWRFLEKLKRYQRALNVLLNAGMLYPSVANLMAVATSFASELKFGGYFTGDLTSYSHGIGSIARSFFENDMSASLSEERDPMRNPPLDHIAEQMIGGAPWWTPQQRVEGDNPALRAIASFFPEEYHQLTPQDEAHVSGVLSCRYDCPPELEVTAS